MRSEENVAVVKAKVECEGKENAARRAAVGEVKGERSEPFTSQQDLQAAIAPATFLGKSGWQTTSALHHKHTLTPKRINMK